MANEFNANWKGKVKYLWELLNGIVRLPAGLAFPATQVPSSDANTLDDYQEADFTPVLGDGTNNFTLSVAWGKSTKKGNEISAHFNVTWTSIGSAGATVLTLGLGDLPLSVNEANARFGVSIAYLNGVDTGGGKQVMGNMIGNVRVVKFYLANDNADATATLANACSASGQLQGSIVYLTA